jgi:hypothetical protein
MMRRGELALDASTWIPMRWPCGPLELEQARRREGFAAGEADALAFWATPASLDRLAGSPVSCLVLSWADGSAQGAEQQRALAPLVGAARKRGLRLVGWVAGGDLRRAAASAEAAGLDKVASESDEAVPGVLRFRGRSLDHRAPSDFLGVTGLVWPGIRVTQERATDASTGPTGPPWLDSNAWYVRLAKSLANPGALWLALEPPDLGQPVAGAGYVQAIADTAIFGGRVLLALDRDLRAGLSKRSDKALESWREIANALAFFETHRDWASYVPVGQLGVVSDYAGANEFLSFEVLNLLARQGSLYRIVEKRSAVAASFDGLDAVLYVDAEAPDPALARKLEAFAEAGGTLIAPPGWAERGAAEESAWLPRFRVFRTGSGRLAVSRAELGDPYLLADDAQLLMSHRHDRIRVFNPGTAQFHYAVSGDGRRGIVHALRFDTPDPRQPLTLWFERPWSTARAWLPGAAEPIPLERSAAERGVEFTMTPLPSYSALELLA